MSYDEVVRKHALRVGELYPDKLREIAVAAGLEIDSDGANNAASGADIARYVRALDVVLGSMVAASARLTLFAEAIRLELDPDF